MLCEKTLQIIITTKSGFLESRSLCQILLDVNLKHLKLIGCLTPIRSGKCIEALLGMVPSKKSSLGGEDFKFYITSAPWSTYAAFVFVQLGSRIQPKLFVMFFFCFLVLPSTYQVYIFTGAMGALNERWQVMHMVNVTMRASLDEQFAADQVGGEGNLGSDFLKILPAAFPS